MKEEYVDLIMIIKELIPIIQLVKYVADAVGWYVEETSKIHIYVHEDNAGCLVLANMWPLRTTP